MEKKEAMKILKDFHDKSALFSVRTALDTIIPELNKSEDNMIKEELIKHLKDGVEGYMPAGDSEDYAKWLAWVENQVGKDKLIRELGEYKVKYMQEVLEKHIDNMNNKDDERLRNTTIAFLKDFADKGYENAVECIDWLENKKR